MNEHRTQGMRTWVRLNDKAEKMLMGCDAYAVDFRVMLVGSENDIRVPAWQIRLMVVGIVKRQVINGKREW